MFGLRKLVAISNCYEVATQVVLERLVDQKGIERMLDKMMGQFRNRILFHLHSDDPHANVFLQWTRKSGRITCVRYREGGRTCVFALWRKGDSMEFSRELDLEPVCIAKIVSEIVEKEAEAIAKSKGRIGAKELEQCKRG